MLNLLSFSLLDWMCCRTLCTTNYWFILRVFVEKCYLGYCILTSINEFSNDESFSLKENYENKNPWNSHPFFLSTLVIILIGFLWLTFLFYFNISEKGVFSIVIRLARLIIWRVSVSLYAGHNLRLGRDTIYLNWINHRNCC